MKLGRGPFQIKAMQMDATDTPSKLTLVPFAGGWHIVDAGTPTFWFPSKASALETAHLMAESRSRYFDRQTVVEIHD